MKNKFYVISTILAVIFVSMLLLKTDFVLSLADSSESSVSSIEDNYKSEISHEDGPRIELVQSPNNEIDTDGTYNFIFKVQNSDLIRECILYHNINQPFGPDVKQTHSFVQLDYPIVFTLENTPDGTYDLSVVCEDRLFRKNTPSIVLFTVKKSSPEASLIPSIEIKEDGLFVLNLSGYFYDLNGPKLTYEVISSNQEIKVEVDQLTGIALIEPEKNWFGEAEIKFIAANKFGLETESNTIPVEVSEEGDTPPRFKSLNAQGVNEEGIDTDGYLFLECNVTDDYEVKELSLYSDVSGEWRLEETREVDSIDSSLIFNIKDIPNGGYSWACSAKDNQLNETLSDKQELDVEIEISLEHTIPRYMVNNIDTDRSIFVSFSSNLKDSIVLGDLIIKKPNGDVYYMVDMSEVRHGEFEYLGLSQIVYFDDVKVIPFQLFDNGFEAGNKVQIEITLDYFYKGVLQRKSIAHEVEVTSRTRSERDKKDHDH